MEKGFLLGLGPHPEVQKADCVLWGPYAVLRIPTGLATSKTSTLALYYLSSPGIFLHPVAPALINHHC